MYGVELVARREGLGLSRPALAAALNVREQNLTRWEFGKNPPRSWDWIKQALTAMEDYQGQLAEALAQDVLERVQAGGEPVIMVYASERAFLHWQPQSQQVQWTDRLSGVPVELHRAAAAEAARRVRTEQGIRVSLEPVPAPAREQEQG